MPRYLCASVTDDLQAYAILDFTPALDAKIKSWVEALKQVQQRDPRILELAGIAVGPDWYEIEDGEAFELALGDERTLDVSSCSAWVALAESETPECLALVPLRTDYDKMLVGPHSTQFEAYAKNTNFQLRTQSFDHS